MAIPPIEAERITPVATKRRVQKYELVCFEVGTFLPKKRLT